MIAVLVVGVLLLVIAFALLAAERFLVSQAPASVILNDERTIHAESGETLLGLLNRNKLFVPSACGGKATCGLCKIQVPSGAGSLLPTEEVFVTRDERARNIRLACQVKVQGTIAVKLPESMLGAREYDARVEAIQTLTHDTRLIRFRLLPPATLDFKPGQYVQLLVPGTDQFRAYSIASPPSLRDTFELIIRNVPGGLCTGWIHRALQLGDQVKCTGPFGDFYLREDSDRDIIAIGGGSGMAPMRSILLHMVEKGMPRPLSLFFGARARRDLLYVEEFRQLEARYPNFRYIPALSEPRPDDHWTGETGFITQVAQKHLAGPAPRPREAVLCGPPPMIDAAMRILPTLGVPLDHIQFDKF